MQGPKLARRPPVIRPAGPPLARPVDPGQTFTRAGVKIGLTLSLLACVGFTAVHLDVGSAEEPHRVASVPTTEPPAPATTPYHVRPGDTLASVATLYAVDSNRLAAANDLVAPFVITPGQVLAVPALLPRRTPLPSGVTADPDRAALVPVFLRHAARYEVPPELLEAIAWRESTWVATARSPRGALGICQLMPGTASWAAEKLVGRPLDVMAASDNIEMAAAYLHWLLDRYHGDLATTLAAYYQGHGSINGGWYDDTVSYVTDVLHLRARFLG
jgi:soluble lytic murein transglycosylase-like protein